MHQVRQSRQDSIESNSTSGQDNRGVTMSENVYKIIEIVGTSTKGADDAIEQAIAKAGTSLHNLDWFEVQEIRGHIVAGKVGHYQVKLKVGFRLD